MHGQKNIKYFLIFYWSLAVRKGREIITSVKHKGKGQEGHRNVLDEYSIWAAATIKVCRNRECFLYRHLQSSQFVVLKHQLDFSCSQLN